MIEVYSKDDFESQLKKNQEVFALFYASWCPFCKSFLPIFKRIITKRNFECVVYVNLDDYDNPLWDEYSVEAVPTVVLFKGGQVWRRLDSGLGDCVNEEQLLGWLREI